jgi:hypothetical protein
LSFQALPGSLLDQHVDECQSLFLVDRFGKQLPITVVVKAHLLLMHLTPPRATPRGKVFRNSQSGAIGSRELYTGEMSGCGGPRSRRSAYFDCSVFGCSVLD